MRKQVLCMIAVMMMFALTPSMKVEAGNVQNTGVVAGYTVTDASAVRYAKQTVNVRSGPNTKYSKLGSLQTNTAVTVTGVANTGWYRIDYNGTVGFVSNKYLVENTAPVPVPAPQAALSNSTKILFGNTYYHKQNTKNGIPIYDVDDIAWGEYILDAIDAAGITNEMTEYEKCVAINNYVCSVVSYSMDDPIGTPFEQSCFTDYCLVSGRAECGGYAEAFQSMCCALGIECHKEGGRAYYSNGSGGNHAWNRVIADGNSYYVDVCWNDVKNGNKYLMSNTLWENYVLEPKL